MTNTARQPAPEPVSGLGAATLDVLPQSVYVVDRDLTVVAWNARREQGPLGLARVRALGRNLREVLSPRGLESVMPAIRHVLDTGTPCEEQRTSKDGRRTYRVRRMPISRAGRVTHVVTVSDDISEPVALLDPPPRDLALSGVIPVCAWCKKIRDQRGHWHQVEEYLATRSDASFTHGICEDCSGRAIGDDYPAPMATRISARPDRPTTP
jgi:PAS domain S-box-containing protein